MGIPTDGILKTQARADLADLANDYATTFSFQLCKVSWDVDLPPLIERVRRFLERSNGDIELLYAAFEIAKVVVKHGQPCGSEQRRERRRRGLLE